MLNAKGKKGKRGKNDGKSMVVVGSAYFIVLASVGFYLYRKERKANNSDDQSISSKSGMDITDVDIEGGILGIAPPPSVENTPAKSVSRRILSPLKNFSSMRSLSPFKTFSQRGKKLIAGDPVLSISSGDSDGMPAIQESCSICSSDKVGSSKDSLDALVESFAVREEQVSQEKSAEPRDSLDALMDDFNTAIGEEVEEESKKPVCDLDQIGSESKSKMTLLEYEEQLINASNNTGFGFRDIFFDPDNELYECRAPSGRLGIVVDDTGIGPRVQEINAMSKLHNKISVGDIIIAVDEVDLVGVKPDAFWQLVSRKANKQERCFVILKI